MQLEWSHGELADGLECYRSRRFFEAHEHWESAWLRSQEPEKPFLQAIIQVAVAFHHLDQHNSAGAASLLHRALTRLSSYPAVFADIEVETLREDISLWLQAIEGESNSSPLEHPRICTVDLRPD